MGDENFGVFEQVHDLQHNEGAVEEILGRFYLLPRAMFQVYVELSYEEQCIFKYYRHCEQCNESCKLEKKLVG